MHQEDQIQKFTCGKATFKNIHKNHKEIIKKSQKIKNTLKDQYWWIRNGDYQKYNWKKMFQNMSQCSAQQLNLEGNNKVQIISQIQCAQYFNLEQLYLYKNKINNIQSLSSIHFNCLQVLGLSSNEISQIKCLNKLSTPSLNFSILLYSNPLIEINALTRSKINSNLLKHLWLQSCHSNYQINQDLSVIVKLYSESVESIQVKSNERISQIKVQSMLKLRFPSIKIRK